jgi:hypothetical protein
MKRFDKSNRPDLNMVVLATFDLFMRLGEPRLDLCRCKTPLVLGSGNAAATGRVLLEITDTVFANESTYEEKLASIRGINVTSQDCEKAE